MRSAAQLADFHALGFQYPDRYWSLLASRERTEGLLEQFNARGEEALAPYAADLSGPANLSAWA